MKLKFIGLILILWTVIIPVNAKELGYISDPDGYTNLRQEPFGNSDIIGVITSGQEFTYYPDNSDWWRVDFHFRTGYIHKSRILNFIEIKAEISKYFQDYYSADRNNVELSEGYNEKLFAVTQNYPFATLTSFCEQRKEIQSFLISIYKSPLHDLIDLQLIYSRLISIDSTCFETQEITDALVIAAGNIGQDLKYMKTFTDKTPDYNKPIKRQKLTNNWFVSEIGGKPITYYLNHPAIDMYSKMFYQGQFALSDDTLTFALLDSVLTTNQETQPFYFHVFNYAVKISDGALSEVMGAYCKPYFEKNICRFIDLKSNELYSDGYQKWIDFVAFEYLMDEEPIKTLNKDIDMIKPKVQSGCANQIEELEHIKTKMIEFIKVNE